MSAGLLAGRTVVVTGGANGIGRAVAALAAQQGASAVVVLDQVAQPRTGTAVEDLVTAAGCAFIFERGDVQDAEALARAVSAADAWGGVDLMVANAGVATAGDGLELSDDLVDRLIDVNVKGVFRSARAAARSMIGRGTGGSIVIIASMGGVRGGGRTVTYSATKGAARLYAQSMAGALGPQGIRVNAVCPGVIDTGFGPTAPDAVAAFDALRERTPLQRSGTAEEVAGAVIWLGSDLAGFVTGASVVVDGGLTAVI